MSTPAGEIIVVRVFGDVDQSSEHVLRAALTEARQRRPSHLVVDVAGMAFCSVRGLGLLAQCPEEAAGPRAEPRPQAAYLLSGVLPSIERHLGLLWPAATLPVRYPSAAAAVLAAMAQQRERHRPGPPTTHSNRPADRPAAHPALGPGNDRDGLGGVTDDELAQRAQDGDSAAYREFADRHRIRMYRSALSMLGSAPDPEDVAGDMAARLRIALAAFSETDRS